MSRYKQAIKRSHKSHRQRTKRQKLKKTGLIKRIKRGFYFCIAIVVGFLFVVVFYNANAFFDTTGGKVMAWSAEKTTRGMAGDLPAWGYVAGALFLAYLWRKHKILTSIGLAISGAIILAVVI